MGRLTGRTRYMATVLGLFLFAAGCSSGGSAPEMAGLDNWAEDDRPGDALADQAADVQSDSLYEVNLDGRMETSADFPPDTGQADLTPDAVQADATDLQADGDAACMPLCGTAKCGDDGCGGSCGQCEPGTSCQNGQCAPEPCQAGVKCDDLDPCTYDDACADSVCTGTPYVCDDQKDCTKDMCDGLGDCSFTIKPTACLINNICYSNEVLRPDNPCEECIPAISKTAWSKDDTNVCSDGNACSVGDNCGDGVCIAGTGSLACDDPGVCKSVLCEPAVGCVVTNAPGSCDDGNPCTVGDACEAGVCSSGSQGKDCSDNNPCTSDECDPLLDCTHVNTPGPCNDGDGCTENDFCDAGACKGGTLKASCNDENPCTTDSCINGGQCQNQWNTLPCNDGNECTVNDGCNKGQCGGTVRDCDDGNPCTTDFCSPLMPGGCYYENNDLGCDDHDPCTLGDTCAGGQCVSGLGKLNCDDSNECTEDLCLAGSGCKHSNRVALCNDGDTCTSGDFCANGQCQGGTDVCQCQFNSDCAPFEDQDKCNGTLYCDTTPANPADWACKVDPLTVKTCSPALDTFCRKNACVPSTGLCAYQNVNDGLGCDDANGCTLNDACVAGVCTGGPCSLVGLFCVNGSCGAQLCTPNTSRCEGNVVKQCNSTGTAEVTLATCTSTQYCAQIGGTAFCAAQMCVPNQLFCQDKTVMLCNADGSGMTAQETCGNAESCAQGACIQIPCHSLSFDGADDFVQVPDAQDLKLVGTSFTVESWVYLPSYSSTPFMYIAGKIDNPAGSWTGWQFGIHAAGSTTPGVLQFGTKLYKEVKTTATVPTGVWTHVAASYDYSTGQVSLWIGGKLKTQAAIPAVPVSSAQLQLGRVVAGTWNLAFSGYLDEVRVSNTIRYVATFTPEVYLQADSQAIAMWRMDETAGLAVSDSSGNGHAGSLVNGPAWAATGPYCCAGSACGAQLCAPDTSFCENGSATVCGSSGSFAVSKTVCLPSQTCSSSGGTGVCVPSP